MNILLKYKNQQTRSGHVGRAWLHYITEQTDDQVVVNECEADLAILYGMGSSNHNIYKRFREQNKPVVIIDMGYWMRGGPNNLQAHYKISVNHWHPTNYIMKLNATSARFQRYKMNIRPWRLEWGRHSILLAGMGPKGCNLYRMPNQQWDINAVQEIQKYTDKKIIYRPKPSDQNPKPIENTRLSEAHENVVDIINRSWCVVTHHSNVAIDALLRGIPCICYGGAAYAINKTEIKDIENNLFLPNRSQFFWNLAYCNWSIQEMISGECWTYIKEHVLPIA